MEEKSKERLAKDAGAKAIGSVMSITIDDNGIEKVLYLKYPHRYVVGKYWIMEKQNLVEAREFLLKSCVLDKVSDMDIIENDNLFYAAAAEVPGIFELMGVKKSTYTIL
jgi:hypothetical protein